MLDKADSWRRRAITYWALGPANIVTVALYRMAKKMRLFTYLTPISAPVQGPFFIDSSSICTRPEAVLDYFSQHPISFPDGPSWYLNPWSGRCATFNDLHWSELDDQIADVGDIKIIWEPSRFDWMPKWAWQINNLKTQASLNCMEHWLNDWCIRNPVNCGLNWVCGQETSMRAMNVLLCAKILDNAYEQPSQGLLTFYSTHLERVLPTIRYAIAQDNNHGTSEAVALFVVGSYLMRKGNSAQIKLGRRAQRKGRQWLENRASKLIMEDGSFSQHSITYHRLMLDTLCFAELFRRELSQPAFSLQFYDKARLATEWLTTMTDMRSGDAPNLGSNDGAYLFNCMEQPYRDFRPSVSLALHVFKQQRLASVAQHALMELFNLENIEFPIVSKPGSTLYPDGGYCRLVNGQLVALLRLPIYRFRPSQADGHHLDIWYGGVNVIRDGGSYCYNGNNEEMIDFFVGTRSHSTVRFDDRNQMPKLSRFLFSDWLKSDIVEFDRGSSSIVSQYTDGWKATHKRRVTVEQSSIRIIDALSGFKHKAEIRWRLMPGDWQLNKHILNGPGVSLKFNLPNVAEITLVQEFESLHYLQSEPVTVLLIVIRSKCVVETLISINKSIFATFEESIETQASVS